MSDDSKNTIASKLMITQECVLRNVERIYETKGYDVAMASFEEMNAFFSTEPGWADAAIEVYKFLATKRKEEMQQLREEKLEEQRAGAPSFFLMNKNEAIGSKDSRKLLYAEQFNGLVEEGAEVNHTKYREPKND